MIHNIHIKIKTNYSVDEVIETLQYLLKEQKYMNASVEEVKIIND